MTKLATGGHPDLKMVNPAAAAINIGLTMHVAVVNPETCETPVRALARSLTTCRNWRIDSRSAARLKRFGINLRHSQLPESSSSTQRA